MFVNNLSTNPLVEIVRGCFGKRRTSINVLTKMSNKIVIIDVSRPLYTEQGDLCLIKSSTKCNNVLYVRACADACCESNFSRYLIQ